MSNATKKDEEACTALVSRREEGPVTIMRAEFWFLCGHVFVRAAGWRCPCGRVRPSTMTDDLPYCSRARPS